MKEKTASTYLLVQGALALSWWLLLCAIPASRALFKSADHPDSVLLSFWLADLACVAGGSLLASRWLATSDRRAHAAVWFASGSITYAALYCIGLTLFTGDALLATACMVPAALITLSIAVRISNG